MIYLKQYHEMKTKVCSSATKQGFFNIGHMDIICNGITNQVGSHT